MDANGQHRHTRRTLVEFTFCDTDPKWHGKVEVAERTTVGDDAKPRRYIDILLHVGGRYLVLPWLALDAIEQAMREARPEAERHRASLMAEIRAAAQQHSPKRRQGRHKRFDPDQSG